MSDSYKMKYNADIGGYDTSMWTPEQWKLFGASGGTVGNNGELITGTGGMLTNNQMNSGGILWLDPNQWGTLTNLGGLAMKAIALPGQMEYYGAQTDLAKQQLASNKQAMADRKTFNANWANASNGLAGKYV